MLQNIRNSEKKTSSGSIVEEDDYISDIDSDSDDGYSPIVQSETHPTTTGSSVQTQPSEKKKKEMSSRTMSRLVAFCKEKNALRLVETNQLRKMMEEESKETEYTKKSAIRCSIFAKLLKPYFPPKDYNYCIASQLPIVNTPMSEK
jgi:hypothetical protein